MISIAKTALELQWSAHTLTPTHPYASQVPPKRCLTCVCACVRVSVWVCVHIPQKDFKTRKKEKHATKIPSSRGLFIEDSSVFFVSGPRVKKKRGEKEKRENSKKITGKNGKKNIKKRKEERAKRTNQQEFMAAYCALIFFFFKKSTKAKTKGITDTDLSQEKTQDQRKLFFGLPSFPLLKKMAAFSLCDPSFSLFSALSVAWASFFFFFFALVHGGRVVGSGWGL